MTSVKSEIADDKETASQYSCQGSEVLKGRYHKSIVARHGV